MLVISAGEIFLWILLHAMDCTMKTLLKGIRCCLDKMDGVFLNTLHKISAGSTPLIKILKVTVVQQAMSN